MDENLIKTISDIATEIRQLEIALGNAKEATTLKLIADHCTTLEVTACRDTKFLKHCVVVGAELRIAGLKEQLGTLLSARLEDGK